MIYRLTGTISDIFSDSFVLKSGFIEWQIEASATTLSRLPRDGAEIQILTYLHHREDVLQLFGFFDKAEKKLFHSLVGVQGIGPKAALRILSGISPGEFVDAVHREDLNRLEAVPGLGKKTAQKIILTLAGKLVIESGTDSQLPHSSTKRESYFTEMEEALVSMGYDRKTVREILPEQANKSASQLSLIDEESQISSPELFTLYTGLEKTKKEQFEGTLLRNCILQLS